MRRGQVSLSLVEAGVGVLLILGVAAGFLLVSPGASGADAQLEAYATDAGTVLTTASDDGPRLGPSLRSQTAFDAARSDLRERVTGLLPASVLFRVETPRGTLGYPVPADRRVGVARVATAHGVVTIRVWYP